LNGETQLSAPIETYTFPAATPAPLPKSDEEALWSGWDVLAIGAATMGILFLVQLIVVLVAKHFIYPHMNWADVAQKTSLALLAEFLSYLIVAIYMALLVEVKYHARFWPSIRWNWPGARAFGFVGIGVLMLGLDLLGRFLPMPKSTPFEQFFDSPLDAYLTAAFAITLGPLMEELYFRGFLYPVLARRIGAFWSVIISAVPFGLMHYAQYQSWSAVLIILLVGVVLGIIRALTKSVAASFLAHVGYNTTLMALAAWATDGFRHIEKPALWLF
jgi:hypothetical protein